MLRGRHAGLLCTASLGIAAGAVAPGLDGSTPARAGSAPGLHLPPSPKVRAIVREVNRRHIERSVKTLVGFGTRHTLSSQTDPNRGIGAARDWIYGQFQQAAAAS